MPQTVTGFNLVCLCHNFGRRGRAWLQSLNGNTNIITSIFMERKEDYAILKDAFGVMGVAIDLRNPPDGTSIMQRAMLFSSIPSRPYSHTVFLDCDLWFPPTFWTNYAAALAKEEPGYWGATVREIPYAAAEPLVDDWQNLTEDRMRKASTCIRYNPNKGKVGHFQCIPTGLLAYPANPRHDVANADLKFAEEALKLSVDKREERRIGSECYHFGHPLVHAGTRGIQL